MGVQPPSTSKAAPETVELVELILKSSLESLSELSSEKIEEFLAVDAESLPKKLRQRFKAKSLELRNWMQMRKGKEKGIIRMPEKNCSPVSGSKGDEVQVLIMAGFTEITKQEKEYLERKTKCTEEDMMCEFTLQIVVEKKTKGFKQRRFFLHPRDPLMAFVGEFRAGAKGGNTNFFGIGGPSCSH